MNLGHQPAEVLLIVRQVIELRGEEVVDLSRLVNVGVAGVEDYVQRFSATQSDRVAVVVGVISFLIAQQLGVVTDHVHRNSKRSQRLILSHVQVGDPEERFATGRNVDDRGQRLREVTAAVRTLSRQRSWGHCVRIATSVQQEELVLHVDERFRNERKNKEEEIE